MYPLKQQTFFLFFAISDEDDELNALLGDIESEAQHAKDENKEFETQNKPTITSTGIRGMFHSGIEKLKALSPIKKGQQKETTNFEIELYIE